MRLETLYHWSPAERRESILRAGLQLYSEPVVHSGQLGAPYLCFSTCPRRAWALSGDAVHESEVERWDLWQVFPLDTWEVSFLPQWGCCVAEVRVRNTVTPDRLWLVGTREPLVFKP